MDVINFPDDQRLARALTLADGGSGAIRLLGRRPNIDASSSPSEILTCDIPGRGATDLLIKYGGAEQDAYGHRGGVAYECEVYRQVLSELTLSAPRFFGALSDPLTGHAWLLVEYISDATQATRVEFSSLVAIAHWLGGFHRACEARWGGGAPAVVRAHDAPYYQGWARRAHSYAGEWTERYPWMATLCRRFEAGAGELFAARRTIIHGEFYPMNVLFRSGVAYPIDWESAAVSIGEIDLSSLTEGLSGDVARDCTETYRLARWPEGAAEGFERRLMAAQLYWGFRWLGERPDWTASSWPALRFEQLESAGKALGLL